MLNWGVIGAGGIAKVFCNGMRFSKTGRIAAIASRSKGRAHRLAAAFSIPKVYRDYESLLADDEIDAIYICTIHPAHAEWVIKAAKAGKHIDWYELPGSCGYDRRCAGKRCLSDGSLYVQVPSTDAQTGSYSA
jgi:hypothetical protein